MSAKLIKGTEIREEILEEITAEVAAIKEKHGVVPGLVTILVGENPASISYVTLKIKTAHRVGFKEIQDSQSVDISEEELLALKETYGDERQTEIIDDSSEITLEDMIVEEDMMVMVTQFKGVWLFMSVMTRQWRWMTVPVLRKVS